MTEFAYGVLAGLPVGVAAAALAGRLVTAFKSRKESPPEAATSFDTLSPEQRQTVYGQVMERREELKQRADKLAGDDPRLRQMLGFN